MPDKTLFTHILKEEAEGNFFYDFSNADGKRWLMPVRHLKTAMHLYQPSGPKGKLLKALFPILHALPPVQRVLHAAKRRLSVAPQLHDLLAGLFPGGAIDVAIFCGTPCAHRKFTIQISRGKRILGYCKLTENAEIAELFKREAALLSDLKQAGMSESQAPRALFQGALADGICVFVQSTMKSASSYVLHEWGQLHDEFLSRMHECTKRTLPFEQTDYARTLTELEAHSDWVPELPGKASLMPAIEKVRARYAGKDVEFSAYHADFTPWNMFVENNRLFVFDWEYAQHSYPPGLDRYHFYTQTATFERRLGAEEILAELPTLPWMNGDDYPAYLLDVTARFTLRERGDFKGDVANSLRIWLKLIEKLSS